MVPWPSYATLKVIAKPRVAPPMANPTKDRRPPTKVFVEDIVWMAVSSIIVRTIIIMAAVVMQ